MLQAPRGTFDILPEEQKYWQMIEKTLEKVAISFGFEKIEVPQFEYKSVFEKGIGSTTDIIEKQMYLLKRLGEDKEKEADQVLRPELTAGIVRAYVQNGMQTRPQPVKLYSFGPVFRYERPQKGRFRQSHQLDLEILGTASPFTDAFLIGALKTIYQEFGLANLIFSINSIGCRNCRGKMKKALIDYYIPYQNSICSACQSRFLKNPLRLLDCKEEKCQPIISNAPPLIDHLCPSCKEHFKSVLEYLEELEIHYDLNPRLVRGLDYYTKTVFEVVSTEDKNTALGGGGRYDDLIELFGGEPTPAIGFAGGIERIISELKKQAVLVSPLPKPEIFLVQLGSSAKKLSLSILFKLYQEGFKITLALDKESLKSQLRVADKLKIPLALILGQKEAQDGTIIVRNMLDGSQETVELKKLSSYLKKRIGGVVRIKKL